MEVVQWKPANIHDYQRAKIVSTDRTFISPQPAPLLAADLLPASFCMCPNVRFRGHYTIIFNNNSTKALLQSGGLN